MSTTASNQKPPTEPVLTHEQRLALIYAPFPVVKSAAPHNHANTHGIKAPSLAQLDSDPGGF